MRVANDAAYHSRSESRRQKAQPALPVTGQILSRRTYFTWCARSCATSDHYPFVSPISLPHHGSIGLWTDALFGICNVSKLTHKFDIALGPVACDLEITQDLCILCKAHCELNIPVHDLQLIIKVVGDFVCRRSDTICTEFCIDWTFKLCCEHGPSTSHRLDIARHDVCCVLSHCQAGQFQSPTLPQRQPSSLRKIKDCLPGNWQNAARCNRIRFKSGSADIGGTSGTTPAPLMIFESGLMRGLDVIQAWGCGPERAVAGWLDLRSDRSATRPIRQTRRG